MASDVTRLSDVDGVAVHHLANGDEVTRATLTFAVGYRDESLPRQGALHALEHVVMHAARRPGAAVNAHVSHSTTEFTAVGSPRLVAEHLERVCQALTDVPTGRLEVEARILAAELDGDHDPAAPLLAARHGLRDHGVEAGEIPGPDVLTQAALEQAARTWFVTGNAFVVVVGPVPSDLRLPLREAQPPVRTRPPVRRWPTPSAIQVDGPACMASLLLPPPDPAGFDELTVELLVLRLTEVVRHREGLSYVLETRCLDDVALPEGGRGSHLLVHAEPVEDRAVACAEIFSRELQSLLRDGTNQKELAQAATMCREAHRGLEAAAETLRVVEVDRLLGFYGRRSTFEEPFDENEVNAYLRGLADDILFLLPDEEVDLRALGLSETKVEPLAPPEPPAGRLFRAPAIRRATSRSARQAVLCVHDHGLWVRLEGQTTSIDWSQVAGVAIDEDGDTLVLGLDATVIPVGPSLWSNGTKAVDAIRAQVPTELVFRTTT